MSSMNSSLSMSVGSSSISSGDGGFSPTLRVTRVKVASWPPEEWTPKMIVFDKDGTIGDCTQALRIWCKRMTEKLIVYCIFMNLPQEKTSWIVSSFHSVIGWSVEKNNVVPSAPLSAGTWEEILDITCECLANSGLHVSIDEVTSWHESLGDIHAEDPPLIEDVQGFLKYLKSHGILISVCSSDDRRSTNSCLRNWHIEDLVDYSLCGDEVTRAKPSPHPLLELCGRAGVLPEECLVVGDTCADVGMGIHGRAGLVVGVLTGSGTKAQLLDAGAHVVLPNIGHLEDLLRCSLLPRTNSSSAVTTVSLESDESVSAEEKKDDNEQHVAPTLVSMKSRGHLPSQIDDDEQDDDCWCVAKGDDMFRFDLKSSNQRQDDPPKPMKTKETAQEVGDDDLMFQFDL